MIRLLAFCLLLTALSFSSAPAQNLLRDPDRAAVPTRPWVVDRTGLTAVPLPARGWCPTPELDGSGVVRLRVDSLDRRAYAAPRRDLQRFLSGVRFLVQQDCPQVQAIEVQGYAAGTRSFLGSLLREEGWTLQGAQLGNSGIRR
ncbi:hypothetical protein [Algihabitans albus]|uniref:hypothetical protein n=1 Tax=Algihabitans albus TaxID=2164067 RepID=UPI000E5C5B17|nr:hypothetical protein [Algihabitans albus]